MRRYWKNKQEKETVIFVGSQRKAFWTLDMESDPFKVGRVPQPFIWGLYGGPTLDEYHEFDSGAEVVRFLAQRRELVYAHNGGKFDYHYLRDYINTGEPISIISGRLSRFRIGECEFRDSMNILPVPLAQFKKDDFDYTKMESDRRDDPNVRAEIRKYLRSDCVNLYELISAHREENGVALTQAGASMRAWSKQSKIKPPRQSAARYQLYKEYYYGGRVQCFKDGTKQRIFKSFDINSAYPFAMLSPHPFSVIGDIQSSLPADSRLHACLITLRCAAHGCFPYRISNDRDSNDGSVWYPDDSTIRRYHVTGYEFIKALELNAISHISIETVHVFEHTVKFEEFILDNWSRRAAAKKAGNKALDIIVKLLMNSLYGKFASDYSKYKEYMLAHSEDIKEMILKGFVEDADWQNGKLLMCREIPEEKHRYYNSATAASITGFTRAMLFEGIVKADDPIYCDTDNVTAGGIGNLLIGDGLGSWKDEGTFDSYSIVGKKTYAYHKQGAPLTEELDDKGNYAHFKVACKGVDLSPSQILAAAGGETIKHYAEVPTYSIKRPMPTFTNRDVKLTAKDIRRVPA